jgi:superfamily II DNA or RNA helicase
MMMRPPMLRPFQDAVVARARDANVVMVGATGIGKTYVAIALLSEQDYGAGKRAFVLAPTRQLVWQIAAKVSASTTLGVAALCGHAVEQWGPREWALELVTTRVVVCTPEVLRTALEGGLVRMDQINLLVFDECHHVTKRHPYAHVIKMYDETQRDAMPRVFGTTACPTRDCARNLHAEIFKVELQAHETVAFAAVAPMHLEEYEAEAPLALEAMRTPTEDDGEADRTEDLWVTRELQASGLRPLVDILTELKATTVLRDLLRKGKLEVARDDDRCDKLVRKFVLSCAEIFKHFGLWCVYMFIELEIERAAVNASLLLHVPGSMFGYDRATQTLLVHVRGKRSACAFAATKRLEKVAALLADRLLAPEEEEEEESSESSETSQQEEDEEEEDVSSLATTEDSDASLRRADPLGSLLDLPTVAEADPSRRRQQGIIFVTTRAECRVVCEFLNERLSSNDMTKNDDDDSADDDNDDDSSDPDDDEAPPKDPLFACLLGQASSRDTASFGLPKMEEILAKFEQGKIQCLVSTAVSVEGVDFPQCSLLIVADRIQSARKLLQLRGRARHEDGVVYYLCETGDHEHAMHFQAMQREAEAIDVLDFRHDKVDSVLTQPRSKVSKELVGFEYFPEESRICVGETGAVLDLDSSIARINMFCQTLPKAFANDFDLKTMFAYEHKTIAKRPLFKAMLTLPEALDLPVFESGLLHSKATAKAAAAFAACKHLYEIGLLDSSLNSVYRKKKGGNDLSVLLQQLHH